MKKIALICSIIIIFLIPNLSPGEEKKNYVMLKPGIYTFTGGVRDADFRKGFISEAVYGYYLHPNLILEGGTGYFHDGVNKTYGNDIKGIPIFLTAKAVYPLKMVEFLAGCGIGVYFVKFHGKINSIVTDARDTIFGSHISLGANFNVSSATFIGIEGKYLFTDKADFKILRSHLDGYTLTANFGFRF
ncbi:MAG: porin family protein [Nitrospira sp.]|nr:porin family protein [Nitrospira sp.]